MEGLQRNGFSPTSNGRGDAPKLNVEIRALEYELAMGFWSGSANTRAALKAICRWDTSSYEKLYRAENKRGAFVVPTGGKTDRLVNQALSDVLNQLLEDRELIACLAGRRDQP